MLNNTVGTVNSIIKYIFKVIDLEGGRLIFELDFRSRLPMYEQLVEKIKELIIREILAPGEQLPSVRILAQQLSINPNTIQKAYSNLEIQGYIYSVKGKGNFVAQALRDLNSEKIKQLEKELLKIVSEMMFLGRQKEDILKIISEVDVIGRGGE